MIYFIKNFFISNIVNSIVLLIICFLLAILSTEILSSLEAITSTINANNEKKTVLDDSVGYINFKDGPSIEDLINSNDIDYINSVYTDSNIIIISDSFNNLLLDKNVIKEPLKEGDMFGTIEHQERIMDNVLEFYPDFDIQYYDKSDNINDIDAFKITLPNIEGDPDPDSDYLYLVVSEKTMLDSGFTSIEQISYSLFYDYNNLYSQYYTPYREQLNNYYMADIDFLKDLFGLKTVLLLITTIILSTIYLFLFLIVNIKRLVIANVFLGLKNINIILGLYFLFQSLLIVLFLNDYLNTNLKFFISFLVLLDLILILLINITILKKSKEILRETQ